MIEFPDDHVVTDADIRRLASFRKDWILDPMMAQSATLRLLNYITTAREIIRICVYRLNYEPLFRLLEKKLHKGYTVQIITNCAKRSSASNQSHDFDAFLSNTANFSNLDVVSFSDHHEETIMHDKFVIVDDQFVLHGSLNWTNSGIMDQENTVLVQTDDNLIKQFINRFETLLADAPNRVI